MSPLDVVHRACEDGIESLSPGEYAGDLACRFQTLESTGVPVRPESRIRGQFGMGRWVSDVPECSGLSLPGI